MEQKVIDDLVLQVNLLDKKVQEQHAKLVAGSIGKSDFDTYVAKVNADQDLLGKEIAGLKAAQIKLAAQELTQDKAAPEKKAYANFLRKGERNLTPDEVKVLTIGDDTTGGYLAVPPDYEAGIIKDITLSSPVRQLADVRQTGSHVYGVNKRTASFSASRTAEIATRSETTGLAYAAEEMRLPEAYALVKISLQNMEDSRYNMEAEINSEIAEQMAVLEGTEFITGTGVGKCEGILTHADLKVEGTGCRHTATTLVITIDDLLSVQYLLKEGYVRNASWLMKRDVVGYLRTLRSGSSGTSGDYYWQPSQQAGQPALLLGSPVVECTDMPGLTSGALVQNTYPIAYGDFKRGYKFVDRIGTQVQRLVELYAGSGQIGFLARRRFNGQVVQSEAIKLLMIN